MSQTFRDDAMPVFKPAWDSVQLLERPYAAPLLAVHAEPAASMSTACAETGVAAQWRFLVMPPIDAESLVHVPRVRCMSRRIAAPPSMRAIGAKPHRTASARHGVRRDHVGRSLAPLSPCEPPVSIVIPTRDRPALLERCLQSMHRGRARRRAELVVVDNGSSDPRVAQLLQQRRVRA